MSRARCWVLTAAIHERTARSSRGKSPCIPRREAAHARLSKVLRPLICRTASEADDRGFRFVGVDDSTAANDRVGSEDDIRRESEFLFRCYSDPVIGITVAPADER